MFKMVLDGAMPTRVMQVQVTPNPNAMKYVLDREITPTTLSYFNAQAAEANPLAVALFGIEGVSGVMLLRDFVTVSKRPDAKWGLITRQVRAIVGKLG